MATYYVRQSGGNDANDGLSFANGWATIQKAADTAVGDDLVLICADGTYTPSVTIDWDTNAGSVTAPIKFRGAGATGDDDGTTATISGSSLGASDDLCDKGIASSYLVFENLRFTAATQYNFFTDTTGTTVFRNCRFDTASSDGFRSQATASSFIIFEDCEFDSNGGDGFGLNSTSRGHGRFLRCSFHDNTSDGCVVSPYASVHFTSFEQCLFYDNGADGCVLWSVSVPVDFTHCVFFGNTSDGLAVLTALTGLVSVKRSIFRSNGGYGINASSTDVDLWDLGMLCSHNNTSGHIDINGGTLMGDNHVLEDPSFTSETDGSEDFTPGNTNLKQAIALPSGGTTNVYIGAIEPDDAASGGLITHPGMMGGMRG